MQKDKKVVHHSHVRGKIIGYAHDFCNEKCRENYFTIPVIAHNQFRFDFFCFLKGIRPSMWETKEICIDGNATSINYAIIRNQLQFISSVKYFQQSLASLADSMTDTERENVRKTCKRFLAEKLMFLNDGNEKWVLDYLVSGKGTIPYQIITDFESLNITPEKEFFLHEDFYSGLKEKNISQEEYENVKKFKILRLKSLGDLNRIYNFQDTAILCEIFEQRSPLLQKPFKFNAKKCNSVSTFSGCIQRRKSKCFIALPTDAEFIRVIEKTVMGGYSCVNTRMAFDTDLFLKDTKNEKVLFETAEGQLKRLSFKIIKMDQNNQYGMAMTRPLPFGCMKLEKKVPTIEELKELSKSITLEDKIGHMFTVDIEFSDQNPKTLLFNEIYPPIFEKNKKDPPHLRSYSQIMSRVQRKKDEKGNIKNELASLPFNSKTHATLNKKIFVNLYTEDLYFLTTRAGWKVTRIYHHHTFKQETFKRNFVVMNQNARKTAKSKVEKDFYKLLNNSNFGYNCRNNNENSSLDLLYDDIDEISYIKKFTNILQNQCYHEFFTKELLNQQTEGEFNEKIEKLNPDNPYSFSLYENLTIKKSEELESVEMFFKNKRK